MPPVNSGRHLAPERIERRRGESWVQSELDVRGQFRLVVLEPKRNQDAAVFNPIGQIEGDFERILCRGEIVRGDAIDEFVFAIRFDAAPDFAAEKTVRSAADFLAAIK